MEETDVKTWSCRKVSHRPATSKKTKVRANSDGGRCAGNRVGELLTSAGNLQQSRTIWIPPKSVGKTWVCLTRSDCVRCTHESVRGNVAIESTRDTRRNVHAKDGRKGNDGCVGSTSTATTVQYELCNAHARCAS